MLCLIGNQAYQLLTIKSIVDKCSDDFNICIIDDNSFSKIIPQWTETNMIIPSRASKRRKRINHIADIMLPESKCDF